MNYFTSYLAKHFSIENQIAITNDIVKKKDTLYILSTEETFLASHYKDIKCKNVKVITNIDVVDDNVFDLDIKAAVSYVPMIVQPEGIEDTSNVQLYGLEDQSIETKLLNSFSVNWAFWRKPVTIEEILSSRFGYHTNPYTGYIEHLRDYETAYAKFIEEFTEECW